MSTPWQPLPNPFWRRSGAFPCAIAFVRLAFAGAPSPAAAAPALDLGARIQPAPLTARLDVPGYFVWFSEWYGRRYYAVARDIVGQFTGQAAKAAGTPCSPKGATPGSIPCLGPADAAARSTIRWVLKGERLRCDDIQRDLAAERGSCA